MNFPFKRSAISPELGAALHATSLHYTTKSARTERGVPKPTCQALTVDKLYGGGSALSRSYHLGNSQVLGPEEGRAVYNGRSASRRVRRIQYQHSTVAEAHRACILH